MRFMDRVYYEEQARRGLCDRRGFVRLLGATAFTAALARHEGALAGVLALPLTGKAPDMIVHTDMPVNLEMPVHYLDADFTSNEAFFVRWHISAPPEIDVATFKLQVTGHVERPFTISLDELRKMPSTEVVAPNQCAGNGRVTFEPRVAGAQWGYGALGQARWRGVPLKALLARASVKANAVDVAFHGADTPPLAKTPRYGKSLDAAHAQSDEVLVAYEMNGAPLPKLHGFPIRLVVPGFYGTFWVKALEKIEVLADRYQGYWMEKAYRLPDNADASESPEDQAKVTRPITRLFVRSMFVRPEPGAVIPAGKPFEIQGIALDSGTGIKRVEVSTDGGAGWVDAKLDVSLGKYAWRRWRSSWTPKAPGEAAILVRATSVGGEVQPDHARWNRSGYNRNVVERVAVKVTS